MKYVDKNNKVDKDQITEVIKWYKLNGRNINVQQTTIIS